MIVWKGRLRGAAMFWLLGSSEKPAQRFCRLIPVSGTTKPEPKAE